MISAFGRPFIASAARNSFIQAPPDAVYCRAPGLDRPPMLGRRRHDDAMPARRKLLVDDAGQATAAFRALAMLAFHKLAAAA